MPGKMVRSDPRTPFAGMECRPLVRTSARHYGLPRKSLSSSLRSEFIGGIPVQGARWSKAGRRGSETRVSPAAIARGSAASAANYNARPLFVFACSSSRIRIGLTASDFILQGSIMSGHPTYQPQSAFMQWMERRLPIGGLIYSSFVVYPTPRNLNYWWTFGGILAFMLGVQIVTGVVLAMHYTPQVDYAFDSVEQIMRDVNYGWLLRYLHSTGASMFFLAAYIHVFRGMYYGSYKDPREVLWILGVILLLLMIITGFMGYVLPWGQMSFWAATVITNLFSAI